MRLRVMQGVCCFVGYNGLNISAPELAIVSSGAVDASPPFNAPGFVRARRLQDSIKVLLRGFAGSVEEDAIALATYDGGLASSWIQLEQSTSPAGWRPVFLPLLPNALQ